MKSALRLLFFYLLCQSLSCPAATKPQDKGDQPAKQDKGDEPPKKVAERAYFLYELPAEHGLGSDKVVAAAQAVYPSDKNRYDVVFTPIDSRHILVSFDKAHTTDQVQNDLKALLDKIAVNPDSVVSPPDTFVAHLLYDRNASTIATALSETFPGLHAAAVGDDTILLSSVLDDPSNRSQAAKQEKEVRGARQLIAMADFPRPAVTISAWNLRISASDEHDAQGRHAKESIETQAKAIGNATSTHNLIIQSAIDRGWQLLADKLGQPDPCSPTQDFLSQQFYRYLAAPAQNHENPACTGLGYRGLFKPLPPNLTHMLLAVIAADNPQQTADEVLAQMEMPVGFQSTRKLKKGRFEGAYGVTPGSETDENNNSKRTELNTALRPGQEPCEESDYKSYIQEESANHLNLACVRQQLSALFARPAAPSAASRLGELRALFANFLFHYRISVLNPHELEPFYFTAAAHNLDAALAPIMDAFTRDVEVFQTKLQEEIVGNPVDQHLSFSAGSIVTVSTLSDTQATVSMQTQNFFNANNPPTLKQFADALQAAEKDQPKILTGNLSADAVTGALGAVSALSQPKATARLGDGVSLTVTPHSLYGASGMELNLTLNADETNDSAGASTSGIVTEGASGSSPDLTSRVAKHDVTTLVRLDSLKLTEVSTVASELVRAKRPLPIILPFLEFPVIGGLVQWPRAPSHVFHRSFAIVSVMEIPTAADLAGTIPFDTFAPEGTTSDGSSHSGNHPKPLSSGEESTGAMRRHYEKLRCITYADNSGKCQTL
ncbi:MAG TPA: hypothetical protein VGD64_13960 [Acidisarcina sp.]